MIGPASFSHRPVLIVGMPRSGTSLVCEMLGAHPDVALLVEPHALWKSGDYSSLDDGDRKPSAPARRWIESRLQRFAGERQLVEKSPMNCLRPQRVFEVLPEAKIIYVERDAAACVHSNVKRSQGQDAFKLSILLKKYLARSGTEDLPHARSYFPIWKQVRLRDSLAFFMYAAGMFRLRGKGRLPFGPRLEGFEKVDFSEGWEAYHLAVWEQGIKSKACFAQLYGENMHTVSLESLVNDPSVAHDIFSFAGLGVDEAFIRSLYDTISKNRLLKHPVPERLAKHFDLPS